MEIVQRIKDKFVDLGPNSSLTRTALRLHGRRAKTEVTFSGVSIRLVRGKRLMRLALRDFYLVPMVLECFDQIFDEMVTTAEGGLQTLDFSIPSVQTYKRNGLSLRFPGMPEEDSAAAYTHWYMPRVGDLVFDVGAHAGFTTCTLSQLIGPEGRVIAFEPDTTCVEYIKENASRLNLRNITVVSKALDAQTGVADFNADGTMGAGLVQHSVYGQTGKRVAVRTISLEDACNQFGVPRFAKIDIEGAEVAVIKSALSFLEHNVINLAFDSGHRMRNGRFTWTLLEPMLRSIGYEVTSSSEFGQMYTWAKRPGDETKGPQAL